MPQTYTVRVIGEREWKDLVSANPRYAHVDESNVGFSDPPNRKAYVRESFLKEFPGSRRYLIQHEFEHLVSDEPWHEDEFGVRHKKFGRTLLNVGLPILGSIIAPGIGTMLGGAAAGGLTGLGTALASGVGAGAGRAIGGAVQGQRALGASALQSGVSAGLGSGLGQLGGQVGRGAGGALGSSIGTVAGSAAGGALGSRLTGGNALQGAVLGAAPSALGLAAPALKSFFNPQTGGVSQATGTSALSAAPVGTNVPAAVGTGATPSGSTLGGGVSGSALSPLQKLTSSLGGLSSIFGGFSPQPQQPPQPPQPPGGGGGGGGSQQYLPGLIGTGTNPPFQPGGGSQQTPSQNQSVLNRLFGLSANVAGPLALGAGLAGLGQKVGQAQMPAVPDLTQAPAVQNLAQTSEARLQPIANQLGGLQNAELPAGIKADILRQFELERRNVSSQFKMFRPNADVATDTDFARAMADLDQRQASTLANAQLSFQGVQRQNLLAQAGVTSDELNTLRDLAQLDVHTIMARTGMRAEQANQIKELFGNIGGTVAGVGVLNAFRTP